MAALHTQFKVISREFAAVDAEAGVIRGVSVITEGPAKGHFDWESRKPLYIDSKTVQEVKLCAETYKGGLKVKMDHFSGVTEIVGALRNFQIDGTRLRADLHLMKTTKHREYVVELATEMPDAFGLSIAFSGGTEVIGDRAFARCSEIYSADLVSEPAANPTGLFEANKAANSGDNPEQTNKQQTAMSEDLKKEITALSGLVEQLSQRLSKLETASPAKVDDKEFSAKFEQAAEKVAETVLTKFSAKFGAPPPAAPSGESQKPGTETKKFEDLVREHSEYAKNKKFAISDTIAKHKKAHEEYLGRVQSGEVILF